MIKPPALCVGDTVAAVTLSWGGPGAFPHRYQAGKRQLEQAFGVSVIETKHALKPPEWIYANPQARADDLMEAFSNPAVKGIISTIGGDESVRILPCLDLGVIRNNPKVFMGYSDTTVTHFACYKAGLTSFYGPSIMAGFGENGGLFPYMEQSVRKTLFSREVVGAVEPCREGWTVEHLGWGTPENQDIRRRLTPPTGPRVLQGQGKARGPLLGGCVEVLEMLKGTAFWPGLDEWRGKILFLETSEEAPDVELFTRWIRNYGSQGILQVISGILLGRPGGQIPLGMINRYDDALIKVVRDELGLTALPVFSQMDFGHTDPMFVLPYGAQAEMECDAARFVLAESAVS